MCGTFEPLPSPLMGEGLGGGEDSTSSPPSPPSPVKGGRGIDLPVSAPIEGEGTSRCGLSNRLLDRCSRSRELVPPSFCAGSAVAYRSTLL
jgi:hypothetical protein